LPTTETETLAALLQEARQRLTAAGMESPGLEARLLVGHALGLDTAALLTRGDQAIAPAGQERIRHLLAQRLAGQPIAYLLGQREFWSLPLRVDARCLIPRPETEHLVQQALSRLGPEPARVLDLGTGSGAVILALKAERPDIEAWAVDRSAAALAVAAANGKALGLEIRWVCGSWMDAIRPVPSFHLIASNPPYLDAEDPHLEQGDLRFEPRTALVAADRGLAALQAIIVQAGDRLCAGGWLLLEHGAGQAAEVRSLLTAAGFDRVATLRDLAGLDRVTEGRRG
jgi:release factor glutamine methyltransferase